MYDCPCGLFVLWENKVFVSRTFMDVDREGLFVEIFNSVVVFLIAIESNFDFWNYAGLSVRCIKDTE